MDTKQTFTIGSDGLLRDAAGRRFSVFVDSCQTAEMIFPEISVICLRLYESTEQKHGRRAGEGDQVDVSNAHQFRMSTRTARLVAERLLDLADQLDGVDANLQ